MRRHEFAAGLASTVAGCQVVAVLAACLCLPSPWSVAYSWAQSLAPRYELDVSFPRPLPNLWVTGGIGGHCIDAQDHVFLLNRQDVLDGDLNSGHLAPLMIELDPTGKVVHSWGDPNLIEGTVAGLRNGPIQFRLHTCHFDPDNNVWIASSPGGMIQKYSHDGKLLLQIGKRGVFDTADGTAKGKRLNAGQTALFNPAAVAVDPDNGDVYVADGYGNRRVAVFDRNGKFLRQWGRQATREETARGEPGVFSQVVHCIAMSNAGLVYVCDRQGDRVQVFDKMGGFQ